MPVLETSCDQGVLTLRMTRPEALNALNDALRDALVQAIATADADPGVRVVVLRGSPRAFSAGGDVKGMGGRDANGWTAGLKNLRRLIEHVVGSTKPVVAAVEGLAVGSGFSLAMACDLLVASETARFRMMFIERGLVPDGGASYFLPRQVGLHRAKEMALSGRYIEAREAYELGLVTRLWPEQHFEAELAGLLRDLASRPTLAAGITKRLMNRTFESDLSTALELETLGQVVAGASFDHAESLDALASRRAPRFEGR